MHTATQRKQTLVTVRHLGFATRFLTLLRQFFVVRARRLTAEKLRSLNDHTLRDIGLSRPHIAVAGCLDDRAARNADEAPMQDRSPSNDRTLRI